MPASRVRAEWPSSRAKGAGGAGGAGSKGRSSRAGMEKRKECEVFFPWVMADVHARSEVWDLVDLQKIGASHSPVRHHHARLALDRRLYTRANASISSSPSSAYFARWTKTYLAAASPPPFFAQSASCALVYRVSRAFFMSSLELWKRQSAFDVVEKGPA